METSLNSSCDANSELSLSQLEQIADMVADRLSVLRVSNNALDWTKIKIDVHNRRISQCGTLSAKDFAWLKVAAALQGHSMAHVAQAAIMVWLREWEQQHFEMLDFVCQREGLSREEAFEKIFNEQIET